MLVWLAVLAASLATALARPDGSPTCSLQPGHGSLSRRGSNPVTWRFTNFRGDEISCYQPNIPLLVKLEQGEFHGFVIKSASNSQFDDLPGPVFRKYKTVEFPHCVTHRDPEYRKRVVLKWTAKSSLGTVTFRAVTFLSDNEDQPTRSGIYSETSKSLQECSYYESHKEPHGHDMCPAFVEQLKFAHVYECDTHGMCPNHMRCCHGRKGGQICYPPGGRKLHHGGQCGHYTDHSPNNCHGKVASNPDDCKLLSTWAATNCRYSCCIAWITTPAPPPTAAPTPAPTWRPRNPDPDCARLYSNKRAVDQCGRWLSSAVGKRNCGFPDTFEARHCQQLCCELGTRVPATPPPYVPPVITQPVTTQAPCVDSYNDCGSLLETCRSDPFMFSSCKWTCGHCTHGRQRPQALIQRLEEAGSASASSAISKLSQSTEREAGAGTRLGRPLAAAAAVGTRTTTARTGGTASARATSTSGPTVSSPAGSVLPSPPSTLAPRASLTPTPFKTRGRRRRLGAGTRARSAGASRTAAGTRATPGSSAIAKPPVASATPPRLPDLVLGRRRRPGGRVVGARRRLARQRAARTGTRAVGRGRGTAAATPGSGTLAARRAAAARAGGRRQRRPRGRRAKAGRRPRPLRAGRRRLPRKRLAGRKAQVVPVGIKAARAEISIQTANTGASIATITRT